MPAITRMTPAGGLEGLRLLVVEDEYFIAIDTAEKLAAAGAIVVGPVATVEDALMLIEGDGGCCQSKSNLSPVDGVGAGEGRLRSRGCSTRPGRRSVGLYTGLG